MFAKPILASSANTRSGVTSVFLDRARIAALMATWILAILKSREACTSAVCALHPSADRGLLSVEIYEVFLDEARLLWRKHE